jgi:hypothetical protein
LKRLMGEMRRSRRTRFLADQNLEAWVLRALRYRKYDVVDCDAHEHVIKMTMPCLLRHGDSAEF